MPVKLSDELKEAIADMPSKEKNRLLWRLIAKDDLLVDKLTFQLLSSKEQTAEDARYQMMQAILKELEEYQNHYYSPGYLLLQIRSISGRITRHVKVTKDKYGEIALNFLMLNQSLRLFGARVNSAKSHKQRTLADYVLKRARKLINMVGSQHEDIALDFEEDMMELGGHIESIPIMRNTAHHHQVDLEKLKRPFG